MEAREGAHRKDVADDRGEQVTELICQIIGIMTISRV